MQDIIVNIRKIKICEVVIADHLHETVNRKLISLIMEKLDIRMHLRTVYIVDI